MTRSFPLLLKVAAAFPTTFAREVCAWHACAPAWAVAAAAARLSFCLGIGHDLFALVPVPKRRWLCCC